jgi:hypothetical protein
VRSALIDTNLFVLLVVGSYDKSYIAKHKRTDNFTEEDYDLLLKNLDLYDELWITSHCVAEVSNLLKQTNSAFQNGLLDCLRSLCDVTKESHLSHHNVVKDSHFLRLGIADTGITQKSKRVTTTFTVDHDLHIALLNLGRHVINFSHLRTHLFS